MKKPNILVINPDQMRWDYASCYGHPFIASRHIDELARTGTRFERAFVSCPMCGPSRTSMVTGQYPSGHGVRDYGGTLDPRCPNALASLQQAGYVRALYGKDHIMASNAIGVLYDEGEDICIGNMDAHPAYQRAYASAELEVDSPWNLTGRLTDAALAFIDRRAGGADPFFLTVNYQDPHPFFACPEPYFRMFDPKQFELPPSFRRGPVPGEPDRLRIWRERSRACDMSEDDLRRAMACYCGQIRYVDDQVGRLLAALEERQILNETVILFWSDHGEFLGDYGVTHKLPCFYDCLIRVPLVVKDPTGRVAPGVRSDMVEAMDAMATLLDIAGADQPAGSVAGRLDRPGAKTEIFAEGGVRRPQVKSADGPVLKAPYTPMQYGAGAALRTDRWKYCVYAEDVTELYDLHADPHEMHNLADEPGRQAVVHEMNRKLMRRLLHAGADPMTAPST